MLAKAKKTSKIISQAFFPKEKLFLGFEGKPTLAIEGFAGGGKEGDWEDIGGFGGGGVGGGTIGGKGTFFSK